MSKRSLQVIIVVLLGVIAWLLFVPVDDTDELVAPTSNEPVVSIPATTTEEAVVEAEPEVEAVAEREEVVLSGVLIGFAEGRDESNRLFTYALIDDSTEIIRVDLRSIMGYETAEIENQLGVTIGKRVEVKGYIEDGEFVATSME